MPPDALPPDDARDREANVVDPAVLAERRAQRAELAERRAADAQTRADRLAGEHARLEADRDAARAEAAAAREGADAVKAEARHLQDERDELRERLTQARAEAAAAREEAERARRESPAPAPFARPSAVSGALERERRLLAHRASDRVQAAQPPRVADRAAPPTALALERERSNRLQARLESSTTVERELRAQLAALEQAVAERREAERRIEAALVSVRAEFDEARRLAARAGESAEPSGAEPVPSAAAAASGASPSAEPAPPASAPAPAPAPARPAAAARAVSPERSVPVVPAPPAAAAESTVVPPDAAGPPPAAAAESAASAPASAPSPAPAGSTPLAEAEPGIDAERLEAARVRLRATPIEEDATAPPPLGTPAPWLPRALRHLAHHDPALAGRVLAGMLPAHGLVAERPLRYDVVLTGRACMRVDAAPGTATVRMGAAKRPCSWVDLRIVTDETGFARLLLGRRRLWRRARVRGARRRVRDLRRLAQAPLGVRDLARAGVALDPALALKLAALAIPPADTLGRAITIAHAPLGGGPADAWLQIAGDGEPPEVATSAPGKAPDATLRCTRGALLALLAGVEPVPGERGMIDGDRSVVTLVREWIARTEYPHG